MAVVQVVNIIRLALEAANLVSCFESAQESTLKFLNFKVEETVIRYVLKRLCIVVTRCCIEFRENNSQVIIYCISDTFSTLQEAVG